MKRYWIIIISMITGVLSIVVPLFNFDSHGVELQYQLSGTSSIVPNIFFEFNSDEIRQEYFIDLNKLGEVLVAPHLNVVMNTIAL